MISNKVTVITICFNASATILKTLESLKDQTFKNIEHVIIDGASTDGTVDIIKSFGNYTVFISEPDSGATYALNKGLNYATGDYIFFLNADDWIAPDFISNAVAHLSSSSRCSFVYSDMVVVGKQCNYIVKSEDNYAATIRYTMPRINYPSIVYRTEVFKRNGLFNVGFSVSPDYEFNLRCFKSGFLGVRIVNSPVYFKDDGNSNLNEVRALKEVFAASVLHGGALSLALLYYFIKRTKVFVRECLFCIGLSNFYAILKKLRYRTNANNF